MSIDPYPVFDDNPEGSGDASAGYSEVASVTVEENAGVNSTLGE